MFRIDPKEISVPQMHGYMLGAVAPRPIAFASTIDKSGNVNLSPFSFFNCFSANPPILVFSPARKGRDNSTKHTYNNVLEVSEVVVNIVDYSMVEQMSLSSTEYPKEVNEFEKAGLTEISSERVKPPRVGESPVAFECKVLEVKPLGNQGGAGNLVICEVLLVHIKEKILNSNNQIDPFKLDAVARMGGNWYCRAQGEALFEIPKPLSSLGIGVDAIPTTIKNSDILTGNDLGRLGNIEQLPTSEETISYCKTLESSPSSEQEIHKLAREELAKGKVQDAWKILLHKW